MNYHLTLVYGESASFLLEEWPAGGVEIDFDVVGLFEGLKQDRELDQALDLYQAKRVAFGATELLKVGLARSWEWRQVGWEGNGPLARRAAERIGELLVGGFPADKDRQVRLLKLVQATIRELGPPAFVGGLVKRASGRDDRVTVYASGAVTYDKTPHPMPFLQELSAVIRAAR